MGKVPAIADHGVTITETNANRFYLADRYSYGELAPKIEEPERGPYLRWAAFATGVMEPATFAPPPESARDAMLATLGGALAVGPLLLGARFSAADVALGGLLSIALFNKRLELPWFDGQRLSYAALLAGRPRHA